MTNYEIIKFKNNEIELDVNVSPKEDTVWLTENQIALLFNRDRSVILKHINNIYKEGELNEKRVCAKFAHTGSDGKSYKVKFYNLDVIISVGYRVKSKNGILFRKWANSVLKQYLLKGYAISNRSIISHENYQALCAKVVELENKINSLEEKVDDGNTFPKIFYKGEYFETNLFVTKIIKKAKKSIIVIDPYFDNEALELFKSKPSNIPLFLIHSSKSKLVKNIVLSFNKEYPTLKTFINDEYHDRFLIIDDAVYHVGTSFNYLGNKIFVIDKINNNHWITSFLDKINQITNYETISK